MAARTISGGGEGPEPRRSVLRQSSEPPTSINIQRRNNKSYFSGGAGGGGGELRADVTNGWQAAGDRQPGHLAGERGCAPWPRRAAARAPTPPRPCGGAGGGWGIPRQWKGGRSQPTFPSALRGAPLGRRGQGGGRCGGPAAALRALGPRRPAGVDAARAGRPRQPNAALLLPPPAPGRPPAPSSAPSPPPRPPPGARLRSVSPAGDLFGPAAAAAVAAASPSPRPRGRGRDCGDRGRGGRCHRRRCRSCSWWCGCCSGSCSLRHYCLSHTAMAPELPGSHSSGPAAGGEGGEARGGEGMETGALARSPRLCVASPSALAVRTAGRSRSASRPPPAPWLVDKRAPPAGAGRGRGSARRARPHCPRPHHSTFWGLSLGFKRADLVLPSRG